MIKRLFKQYLFPYTAEHDKRKALFIHIPKAAGTSVSVALFGRGHGHLTARRYRFANKKKFNSYFKFTITRHPVGRFVSAFNYLKSDKCSPSDKKWAKCYLSSISDINQFCERLSSDPQFERSVFQFVHS